MSKSHIPPKLLLHLATCRKYHLSNVIFDFGHRAHHLPAQNISELRKRLDTAFESGGKRYLTSVRPTSDRKFREVSLTLGYTVESALQTLVCRCLDYGSAPHTQ